MGYNSVPPRWEEYTNIGKLIPGTQIIPFKAPLREEICQNLRDLKLRFTLDDLVSECVDNKLSLIIDLTQTTRFYNSCDLEKYNIKYVKFKTPGGGQMPRNSEIKTFCKIIHNHLKENPKSFVGVHCTHGLNRTGFFICNYMIDYLKIPGSASVKLFEESRGHIFDRDNYRQFLLQKEPENTNYNECKNKSPTVEWCSPGNFQKLEKKKFNERFSDNDEQCNDYKTYKKSRNSYVNNDQEQFTDYRSYKRSRSISKQNNEYKQWEMNSRDGSRNHSDSSNNSRYTDTNRFKNNINHQ